MDPLPSRRSPGMKTWVLYAQKIFPKNLQKVWNQPQMGTLYKLTGSFCPHGPVPQGSLSGALFFA
jgi:hypothetical protein